MYSVNSGNNKKHIATATAGKSEFLLLLLGTRLFLDMVCPW